MILVKFFKKISEKGKKGSGNFQSFNVSVENERKVLKLKEKMAEEKRLILFHCEKNT